MMRILIFSSSVPTVLYLAHEFSNRLSGYRIGTITGQTPHKERLSIIRRFAPNAQGRPRRSRKDDLDILIATDAIAEGLDLQDATVLVNYDLHWTPLRLIQRVGRVDRPTKTLRNVDVVNFYPDGGLFEQIVQLWRCLSDRSKIYETMARTSVVGEFDRDLGKSDERDLGLVNALYKQEDYECLLREYVPTSRHLAERAKASEEQIKCARDLPLGFRSAKCGTRPGAFALLRFRGQYHCVFRDDGDGALITSPDDMAHEALLVHVAADPSTPLATITDAELDEAASALLDGWCATRGVDPDEVVVVCVEVIIAAH
jgi:hypothetical protein